MKASPLVGALQNASLHALLMVVGKVLAREGFGDIEVMGRRRVKQKSRFGGFELKCTTTIGSLPGTVIVKVVRDTIRVRMLDEFAGAVIRTGADIGLIVSPFSLTRTAEKELAKFKAIRIDVIAGEALAKTLTEHRIGVRGGGSVDYAFFGELEALSEQVNSFISKTR